MMQELRQCILVKKTLEYKALNQNQGVLVFPIYNLCRIIEMTDTCYNPRNFLEISHFFSTV